MRSVPINLVIAVSAILAIYFQFTEQYGWFSVFKPLTTVLIIFMAGRFVRPENRDYTRWILAALTFCLLGDTLLLREDLFVFGLGAFLVGHLLFIRAFVVLNGFQKNWTTLVPLTIIGIGLYAWFLPNLGELAIPVAVYVSVIVLMAWQGINVLLDRRDTLGRMIALAALLFMFSDSMIAVNKFMIPFEWSGMVILSTYWWSVGLLGNTTRWPNSARR